MSDYDDNEPEDDLDEIMDSFLKRSFGGIAFAMWVAWVVAMTMWFWFG